MKVNTTDLVSTLEGTLGGLLTTRSITETSLSELADSAPNLEDTVSKIDDTVGNSGHDTSSIVTGTLENVAENAQNLTRAVSDQLVHIKSNVSDMYAVGLWGYCRGTLKEGGVNFTDCTKPDSSFWFNFTEVLDLRDSWAQRMFPNQVEKVVGAYKAASKGVRATYIAALSTTILTLGSGVITMFSGQLGVIVRVMALAAAVFNIAASATATGIYVSLIGVLQSVFSSSGISATLGQRMLATSWLATAFSIIASVLWLLSCCCI
ncbi:actin cortical patch SUR7/pH-response regulator pali [Aspergillus floccosus]